MTVSFFCGKSQVVCIVMWKSLRSFLGKSTSMCNIPRCSSGGLAVTEKKSVPFFMLFFCGVNHRALCYPFNPSFSFENITDGSRGFTASTTLFTGPSMSGCCSPFNASEGFLRSSRICLARRMRGGRRARHREPNPGDWLCQCGETNYRSKRECFKCGAPAPPLPPGVRRPSLPGEDPNDWACACGQMNFRGSVVCHKCSQPKPVPPGQETTPLWTCPTCSGINREHRKTCFKCGAVSPNIAFS